jgi:hypothetical protein
MKDLLLETKALLAQDPTRLPHKCLEQIRGFLIYNTCTYPGMVPYLIGFHLTIDSWLPNRGPDGWRLPHTPDTLQEGELYGANKTTSTYDEGPTFVKAADRFKHDVDALLLLTSSPKPPLKLSRPRSNACVYYGFGDASGDAFGASFQIGNNIHFDYGQWTTQVSKEESSNWRELANLTEALEDQVHHHGLQDCELFLFTNNTTAEAAFLKGTSKSPRLFELVLRLCRSYK